MFFSFGIKDPFIIMNVYSTCYLVEKLKLLYVAKALHVPCLTCKSWIWYLRCLCLKKLCFHVLNALNSLSWVLNRCMMFTNEKSHIYKWTHGSVALTWHEIACRCLWWPCDENLWPCMKFVSYLLFLVSLTMFMSYAHEREFLWKMLHFNHGYATYLYVPFYLVGDACAQIVAILLVYVSILACCSAPCIFEKHMLAFVDLILALPTRGRKVLKDRLGDQRAGGVNGSR
jgi:hypothetical protein